MTTLHKEDSPYPFVPHHTFGVLLRKNDAHLVMWTDYTVEAVPGGGGGAREVLELVQALQEIARESGRNMSDVVASLVSRGYEDRGSIRFNFMSGSLYQNAVHLTAKATKAEALRQRLIAERTGRFPAPGDPDWAEWYEATTTRNASVMGARLLALASLEALANEILFVRFPVVYEELEGKRNTFLMRKLRRLAELVGLDAEPSWLTKLQAENDDRREIVHHKPGYVYESREDERMPLLSPDGVLELIGLVDEAFAEIFRAFGTDVPSTHRPDLGEY